MNLTATYQSITSLLLEWMFVHTPGLYTRYGVYYQSGGVSYNSSFTPSRDSGTFYYLALPPEGIHSIFLVAMNQAEGSIVYLPSLVAGPVDPGRFFQLLLLLPHLFTTAIAAPVMRVSGEGSGVAGTSYSLTCRVRLPSGVEPDSLDIQWVGLPTPQPVMISAGVYIRNVTLNPLSPTTTSYTCRASYTESGVSLVVEDSISVNVVSKSTSSPLSVYLSSTVFLTGPMSREVGSSFILACTVTLSHRARDSSVSIQWQGPSTDEHRNRIVDDTLIINELTLDPLTLADGGDYYCTAHYTTASGYTDTISSDVEQVFPISESSVYQSIVFYAIFPVPSPSLLLRSDSIILVGEETVVYCDIDLI